MDRHAIKRLRKKLKLTQEKFSVIVGVDRRSICRWETGEAGLTRATVRLLTIIEMFHNPKIQTPDTFTKLIAMLSSIDNLEKTDLLYESEHAW